nr:hypothetical protein [Providencia rettgeri]
MSSIPVSSITYDPRDRHQQKYFIKHKDIQFVPWGREYLDCGFEFITYEIDKSFIDELLHMRNCVSATNEKAEKYDNAMQTTIDLLSDIKTF